MKAVVSIISILFLCSCEQVKTKEESTLVWKVVIHIVYQDQNPIEVQIRMAGSNISPSIDAREGSTQYGDRFYLPISEAGSYAWIQNSEELEKFFVYVRKNVGNSAYIHLSKQTKNNARLLDYELWDTLCTAFLKSDYVLNSKIDKNSVVPNKGGYKKTMMFFSKVK